MNKIPTYHQTIQNKAISFYHKHQAVLNDMQIVYSCGIGASYGVALEAALKMGETIKVPSFAYESEEFLHGPNLQVNENYTLFLIDDNKSNSQRIKEIYQASKQLTTKTFLITNSEINDDDHVFNLNLKIFENLLAPIYIVPFFQILAYEITSDLKRWPQNPLMKGFKESLKIKTADIKKIYD